MVEAIETAPCPTCSAESPLEQVGSASGRKHYRCPTCGPWRAKNAAAAALGALGGKRAAERMSGEERRQRAENASNARWRRHKLSQNGPRS